MIAIFKGINVSDTEYIQYTYLHSPVVLVLCKGVMMVVVDPLLFQGEPLELNLGTLSLLHCLELVCCRHWPTQRRGLGHLTERTTCTQHASKCRNHVTQRKDKMHRNRTSLHLLPKSCCRSTSLSVRECARMGGPRAAPGYGRRARGDPDASGSIRGCTPPAAATQIRNKTKVGNLIRVADFPNGTVVKNVCCVQEQCCHYSCHS